MRKFLALIMVALLAASFAVTGCGGGQPATEATPPAATPTPAPETAMPADSMAMPADSAMGGGH